MEEFTESINNTGTPDSQTPVLVRTFTASDLRFTSFYLAGLAEFAKITKLRFKASLFRGSPYESLAWSNNDSILLGHLDRGDAEITFCLDVSDDPRHFVPEALEACDFYFKVNFDDQAIITIDHASRYRERIGNLNPGFPLGLPFGVIANLVRTTHVRLDDLKVLQRSTRTYPDLDWFLRRRNSKKLWDVHFVVAYYHGRHEECNEFRLEIMERLKQERSIRSRFGFYNIDERAPDRFKQFATIKTSRRQHLMDMARARTAIYVRGPHTAISFKFGEQMALGLPVVGQKLANNTAKLDRLPLFTEQFQADTPADLVSNLRERLQHPDQLERFAVSNAATFDTSLSPGVTVSQMLQAMLAASSKTLAAHADSEARDARSYAL